MRALAAATPRVKVFDIGKTEEGRDLVVVAIADEATIKDLDTYKAIAAKLADPRNLTDAEAQTPPQAGQAHLLGDGRHALLGDRLGRDADGARLSPGGRRVAVHQDDP